MHAARLLAVVLGCLVASKLAAQNVVYYGNPSTTTGTINAYPMGEEGIRTQQLIPGSVFGGVVAVINDIYFASAAWTSGVSPGTQVYYDDIEIRMSSTSANALTNDWATNMPMAQTVYRGPLLVKFEANAWSPIGLPQSYVWIPFGPNDNLVVDFIIWSVADTGAHQPDGLGHFWYLRTDTATGLERAASNNWTAAQSPTAQAVDDYGAKIGFLLFDGQFVAHEGTCPGSSGATPTIGAQPGTWPIANATFDVELTGGPANSVAALVLSTETSNYLGVSLPFDMTILGATACTMWHGLEVALPGVPTNGAGAATYTLAFPSNFPGGVRFYGTWLTLDTAANTFGIVPSGFATMSL